MKKVILFLIVFFALAKPAMAGYVNWLQEDTAEFYSEAHGGNIATGSSLPSTGDNDLNTFFGAGGGCGPNQCPVVGGFVTVTITFSTSNIKIDKTELTLETNVQASGQLVQKYYVKIYNGDWHTVSSGEQTGNYGKQTITANFSEYSNVSKIEILVYGMGATAWMGGSGFAKLYEIKAWGNKYVDIGLRAYDGTNVIKLACEPAGVLSTPLRINKNGPTYSIALVDPSDPKASKIKIRTNSGIKALAKIN